MAVTVRPRSLWRNVGSALSGNSVYALSQFGMLSALALLTSPVEVGRYALGLAITAPVFIFASLKLRQVQVTDAAGDYTFGQYLAQRITTSTLALTGVVVCTAFIGMAPRTFSTIAAVAAFKALESLLDIIYGAMQRREQLHLVARSQMVRGIVGFVIFAGVVWLTGKVELAAWALAGFTVFPVATNFWRVRRLGVPIAPSFSLGVMRRLTWLALPLGVATAVGSLTTNVPRYFIEAIEGTAQLGIFAALAYFLVITGMVVNSLGEAASPRLANLYSSGEYAQFRGILRKLVLMGGAVGVVGVIGVSLLGRPILNLVYGDEYGDNNTVLIVLMASATLVYMTNFLGTAINAMRRFTIQMPINLAILAVTAATSWLAIPELGIMGGAVALVAGQLAGLICYLIVLFRVILPATVPAAK